MKPLFGSKECYKLYLSDNFDSSNKDLVANIFTFPGGEPHVKISAVDNGIDFPEDFHNLPIRIYQTIKSFNDFGVLCMAVDALRRQNVWKLSLVLPYFPGARQDRTVSDICEPLSVKVYADLINNLKFDEVIIFDPHSDVAPALINNCVALNNHLFVQEAMPRDVISVLVCPDAGAVKKIDSAFRSFPADWNHSTPGIPDIVYFSKHRDMKTGELSGFSTKWVDLDGLDCVIVDDICDGGGTFLAIAEHLRSMNCQNIHLVVSHGLFSAGIAKLFEQFETITTTNSWHVDGRNGIEVIDLIKLYDL